MMDVSVQVSLSTSDVSVLDTENRDNHLLYSQ